MKVQDKALVLVGITLLFTSIKSIQKVNGQAKKEKLLCDRIANQCRTSCQTYWDECHPQLLGGPTNGFTQKAPMKTTPSSPIAFPVFGLNGDVIRPAASMELQCSQYRDDCHLTRPCCKGYNCRYSADNPGVGKCF